MFSHILKLLLEFVKFNELMKEIHDYMSKSQNLFLKFLCALFKYLFGAKLVFFVARSSFPQSDSSFSPMCSGAVTYLLVALPVAVLLKWMKWVATEPICIWPKRHSMLGHRIGLVSSGVTRMVAMEHVQNEVSFLQTRSLYFSCFKQTQWQCHFQFWLLLFLLKRWIYIKRYINCF